MPQSFKVFPYPLSCYSLEMTFKVFPKFLLQALSDIALFSKDKFHYDITVPIAV